MTAVRYKQYKKPSDYFYFYINKTHTRFDSHADLTGLIPSHAEQ